MATVKVNGKTVKAQKLKKPKNLTNLDEKYTGEEPTWDTERATLFSDQEFDRHLVYSFRYYNYYYTQKDLKKHVIEWSKDQKEFEDINVSDLSNVADHNIPMTVCSLIMAHKKGMPFRKKYFDYTVSSIKKALDTIDESVFENSSVIEKPKTYTPTIQDRLNEKTAELIGELEWHYDRVFSDPKHTLKPYDFLVANNVPQNQLTKYEDTFSSRMVELTDVLNKKDDQLVEGYKHFKLADIKRAIAFVSQILADVEQYRGIKKATKKSRVKRPVSKEKLVSKLKHLKENKELKLISINPADIVGATELFVYNVKTRKIGRYIADPLQGQLSVKGTSIIGYDEHKSIAKTIRKPEEKLKEFAKAGKIQLRKFLDDIKATATLLNGRVNSDTILLKVL